MAKLMNHIPHLVDNNVFDKQVQKALVSVTNKELGFWGPDSVLWKVMKKIFPLYMASSRLLIMQSIHIWMAQAGNDASYAFSQPMNRAYRTYVSISMIIFGTVDEALQVSQFIRKLHETVKGELKTSKHPFADNQYQANESNALMWVHAALWESIVNSYNQLNIPLTESELNQLNQELKIFAYLFGIEDEFIPESWSEFIEYNQSTWDSNVLGYEQPHQEMVNYFLNDLEKTMPGIFKPFFDFHREYTISTLPLQIQDKFALKYNARKAKAFLVLFKLVNKVMIPFGFNEKYVASKARLTQKPVWKFLNSKAVSYSYLTSIVWGMRTSEGSRFEMPQLKEGRII